MELIGAFDAKTKLSELLQAVQQGKRFIITNRGVPVAQLGPLESKQGEESTRAVEELQRIMANRRGGATSKQLRAWRDEGRA